MIRFLLLSILIMLVARGVLRVLDGVLEAAGGRPRRSRPKALSTTLARDPVCGTFVAPPTSVSLTVGQTTHYFCSQRCRDAYRPGAMRPQAS